MMETTSEAQTMTSRIDNYIDTCLALAEYVLANAPDGMHESRVRDFKKCIEDRVPQNWWSIEFRRDDGRADCCLELRVNYLGERLIGSEGHKWQQYAVTAKVNWPTWGTVSVEDANKKLALMQEVTNFAAQINSRFTQEMWAVVETKEEIEERQKQSELARIQDRVQMAFDMDDSKKRMRVGSVQVANSSLYVGVPTCTYHVEDKNGKMFTVDVGENCTFITRTK